MTGFISVTAPELNVSSEVLLSKEPRRIVDLVISEKSSKVLVELKARYAKGVADSGVLQVVEYIRTSGIKNAVLFLYDPSSKQLKRTVHELPEEKTEIIILSPLHLNLD